jgi:hypothetical protein
MSSGVRISRGASRTGCGTLKAVPAPPPPLPPARRRRKWRPTGVPFALRSAAIPLAVRDRADGRGWVRTSDLSRVRRSASHCRFGLFAGKKPVAGGASQRCGSDAFAGIHSGLGERPAALAQRARLANDSVASRVPVAGGENLCQSDPLVDISVTAMIPTGLIATPTGRRDLAESCPSWVRVPPPQGSRERDVRSQRPCPLRRRPGRRVPHQARTRFRANDLTIPQVSGELRVSWP